MPRVVIAHEFDASDPAAAVYRVTHGVEVVQSVAVLDEEGRPKIRDGKPITQDQVAAYRDIHDIVFAADDERWLTGEGAKRKRRPDDEVAADQVRIIADALVERGDADERDARARAAAIRKLPGAGVALPARPRAPRGAQ